MKQIIETLTLGNLPLRPTRAIINLKELEHNFKLIKNKIGNSVKIIAAVKADAYGHGAIDISKRLLKLGVDILGVAYLDEAIQLRREFPNERIMIFATPFDEELPYLIDSDIIINLAYLQQAKKVDEIARKLGKKATVHIKVDTGMGRIGIPVNEAFEQIGKISTLRNLSIEGMFTHFPSSDERDKSFTLNQINAFVQLNEKLNKSNIRIPILHTANTAAIEDIPTSYFNAVRPGISLYGLQPSQDISVKLDLHPILKFVTKIVFLKEVPKGTPISYGRTFITQRTSTIATLPVGYHDGYNRLLSNRAQVEVKGQLVPVVGRVCMDLTMIDVTDIKDVKISEAAILYSNEKDKPNSVENIARMLETIPYEVTCNLSNRVPRTYIDQ